MCLYENDLEIVQMITLILQYKTKLPWNMEQLVNHCCLPPTIDKYERVPDKPTDPQICTTHQSSRRGEARRKWAGHLTKWGMTTNG